MGRRYNKWNYQEQYGNFDFALTDAEMDILRALDTNKGIHDPDRPGVKEMLLGAFDVHAND